MGSKKWMSGRIILVDVKSFMIDQVLQGQLQITGQIEAQDFDKDNACIVRRRKWLFWREEISCSVPENFSSGKNANNFVGIPGIADDFIPRVFGRDNMHLGAKPTRFLGQEEFDGVHRTWLSQEDAAHDSLEPTPQLVLARIT
ncbi:hypothetical protein PAAG_11526 [Paracoccidioides lutzii Pb01]|uniref:Uncharacterized protein n=1 Tax=Paracoccidioides lutzii (strain ATCC MYA-826 / Pb01) TaxID=502779 RepID=A0A0A2V1P8_PARBA|nr:hypothetical protein PAAG_11526 [Paracoccidioides lutzii Pb01]KGQ01681.1 hypothetical protein PAAG_11526 [Paracoccidioides lutzii Pb01]